MGGYDDHRRIMDYLAVSLDFRGKGFGKMLVEEIEKKLKQLGCPKVNLLVRSDNVEASNFYESIDYKKQMMFQFLKRDLFLMTKSQAVVARQSINIE